MKRNYLFIFTILAAIIVFAPAKKVMAQSELIVEWQSGSGEVITDALRTAIEADVNRPADRVYKLRKGGFYWITETISNSGFALNIVGEDPGAGELDNPAVVQMVTRTDGTVNTRMITGGGDITLKNLYIIGADNTGTQTAYQPIQVDASNSRFIIDNCIFERSNFALMAFTAGGNDIFFTNCKFRNLIGQPSTQQWEGRGISIWADQDSVIVENCTFLNVGFTAFQLESGAASYFRFNHNTLVNVGRGMTAVPWFRNAYIANNLIVNGFWHGEGYGDVTSSGRDPRAWYTGMFGIGALPSKYGPEQGRRILFGHNASWRDPGFAAYYADTIRPQWFINQVTKEDYLDVYENMVARDTFWLAAQPNFGTYPSDIIPNMIQNISDLRAGVTPATPYFWRLSADATVPSWPLPENFTYTDANLMTLGSDGLPLGDLNWFPTQKGTFEANKAQYISDLEKEAGPVVVYTVVGNAEAETGTLSNGATVNNAAGTATYRLNAGFIKWTFDLTTAAQYDINVLVDLNGRGTSGVNFFVNDFEIHDTRGWGQYVFGNDAVSVHPEFPLNGLNWWLIRESELAAAEIPSQPLHMLAGSNTVEIRASWSDNFFGGIDILEAGTTNVVKSLSARDVTEYSVAAPRIGGSAWTPNWFKSVALGSGGSVAITYNAPETGNYAIQASYQNVSGPQTLDVKVDGTTATTVSLGDNTDSTAISTLSDAFPLTAGSHTLTLTGSGINLDYVQLVQKTVVGIRDRNELPQGFNLAQNYPNPFNPSTTINFDLGKPSNVKLTIFNILGQKVATLINNNQMNTGTYSVDFNASQLSSGVYFYSLEAGDVKIQKKMMLLK